MEQLKHLKIYSIKMTSSTGNKEEITTKPIKPFSVHRFATLWDCDCDFEVIGKYAILLIEPLQTSAPEWARASWSFGQIEFRNPLAMSKENPYFDKGVRHHELENVSPMLVRMRNGKWYELGMPSIKYRQDYGCWCLERKAFCNSRLSSMMNGGQEFYRSVSVAGKEEEIIELIREKLKS